MERLHLGVIGGQAIELPTGALPLPLHNYQQRALWNTREAWRILTKGIWTSVWLSRGAYRRDIQGYTEFWLEEMAGRGILREHHEGKTRGHSHVPWEYQVPRLPWNIYYIQQCMVAEERLCDWRDRIGQIKEIFHCTLWDVGAEW